MSYTFEVRFAGLCAFVPELPLDASSNRVTVLLANPKARIHVSPPPRPDATKNELKVGPGSVIREGRQPPRSRMVAVAGTRPGGNAPVDLRP